MGCEMNVYVCVVELYDVMDEQRQIKKYFYILKCSTVFFFMGYRFMW
jgi:hypothetical protein